MATHFINYAEEPIKLRTTPNSSSVSNIVYSLTEDIQVDILEEFVYENCGFHHVKIDDTAITSINQNEYFVENKYINTLFGTPDSAPVNCEEQYANVSSYEEPDWLTRPIDIAYFNPKDLVYKVPITTPYRFINNTNRQQFNDYCLTKGIKKILDYLSKDYTDESIEQYKSYFKFAEIEDYEVPLRELSRIKALVSCHIKYLNAIPLNLEGMMNRTKEIIKVKPYELKQKIDFVFMRGEANSLFKYYYKDSLNATFSHNFTFENEGKHLLEIYNDIIRMCNLNNASYSERRKQDYYEICLDDCTNIVYMSYFDAEEKVCIPITTGLIELDKKVKKFKYNPIFYLKNIDAISIIDFCKLPYTDFIDTYSFFKPDIKISGNTLEDMMNDFLDMSEEEIYKMVEKFIIKVDEEAKEEQKRQFEILIKKKENSKKVIETRRKLTSLKKRQSKKLGGTPTRNIDSSLQEEIDKAQQEYDAAVREVYTQQLSFKDKFLDARQLDPITKAIENRLKYFGNMFKSQFVGLTMCDPNAFGAEDNEFMKFLKSTEEEVAKPKKKFKDSAKEKAGELYVNVYLKINKIYSDLFKCINLCTISEKLLKCITLALDFLDASVTLTTGAMASFSYTEFKEKIIPNLQESDKRIFYDVFINESCIKQKDIIDIFIKTTGDRSYADKLSSLSYDEAKAQLIEKLV